jgi:hypothetical protein
MYPGLNNTIDDLEGQQVADHRLHSPHVPVPFRQPEICLPAYQNAGMISCPWEECHTQCRGFFELNRHSWLLHGYQPILCAWCTAPHVTHAACYEHELQAHQHQFRLPLGAKV